MYKRVNIHLTNYFRSFSSPSSPSENIRHSLPKIANCITALRSCAYQTNLTKGKQLHSYMIVNGFLLSSQPSITSLINMYSKCNSISDAFLVFCSSPTEPNVFAYNAIIAGFIFNEMPKPAVGVYEEMRTASVVMDRFTLPCVIKAFADSGDVVGLKKVHGSVFKFGLELDLFAGSAVVHGYLKFGLMRDARQLFDELADRDVVLWNAMINGYAQIGEFDNALKFFRRLCEEGNVPSRFTVTGILSVLTEKGDLYNGKAVHGFVMKMGYFSGIAVSNALIDMYGKSKCIADALDIFEAMEDKDIYSWNSIIGVHDQCDDHVGTLKIFYRMMRDGVFEPDLVTVASVLPACSHLAALKHGKEIHGYMIKDDALNKGDDVHLSNSLMYMYAKCGSLREAQLVFDRMTYKDSASWNILIMGYGMHGFGKEAVDVFSQMCEANFSPNEVTFIGLLSACSHAGLVNQGREFLVQMQSKYNIVPTIEHYTCMVDMFGRAGLLDEAYDLLSNMPIPATSVVWRAFLAACRLHGDAAMAEIAVREVLDLEPEHCGSLVLVSNVFGAMARYGEVSEVRHSMRQQNVKKTAGCSWIESEDSVHVFVTGDRTHPQDDLIYRELSSLYMSMDMWQT